MRTLAPLLLLTALAAPFGDAGAFPSAAAGCGPGGAFYAGAGPGEAEPRGPERLSPFALASSTPAEGASGGNDGPRRGITTLARRIDTPAASALPRLRLREAAPRRAPLGDVLRGFRAHPSTAPPRIA